MSPAGEYSDNPYCLVLSGGGAKGVYHVGALRALRELGVRVNAVVGNSVGALIAGFVAQGNYEDLERIVSEIGVDDIVSIPDNMVKNGEFVLNRRNLRSLRVFGRHVFEKGGLDTLPLRRLLEENLEEGLIRDSGVDLGVVTYRLRGLKPKEVFLEDMEPGTVLTYLQASATIPGFTVTKIKDQSFIDGGVYDNIPFSMAKSRGYKRIIVIDISGLGINRRADIAGTQTVYIKNTIKMGGVLDFDRVFLKRYCELGYLDTLKVFGGLKGYRYAFEADDTIRANWELRLQSSGVSMARIRSMLHQAIRHASELVYALADCGASCLSLERVRRYTFKQLLDEMRREKEREDRRISSLRERFSKRSAKNWIKEIRAMHKAGGIHSLELGSPYSLEIIAEEILGKHRRRPPMPGLKTFFPYLEAGRFFLRILGGGAD